MAEEEWSILATWRAPLLFPAPAATMPYVVTLPRGIEANIFLTLCVNIVAICATFERWGDYVYLRVIQT